MAGDAAHILVGMGTEVAVAVGHVAPLESAVAAETDRLGQLRAGIVVFTPRIDRVDDLLDLPAQVFLDHRILDDLVAAPLEALLTERGEERRQVASGRPGRVRGGAGRP